MIGRMLHRMMGMLGAAMLAAAPILAQSPPADMPPRGDLAPVDYGSPSAWLCRPGVDDGSCSANLDAVAIDAKGARADAPYAPAKAPAIDCFYVYPTVSADPTMYSDMVPGPEERRTVHAQAARLGAQCRVFAPLYHQLTSAALRWGMTHPAAGGPQMDFDPAYRDVVAAWKSYLAHDNKGRGVVLVGHSQGAILVKRLIAEEIDGKPARKMLVAAYLAGNVDLTDRSFRAIPPCAAIGQTGCVVAWSSYRDGDDGRRFFGGAAPGTRAICVNPAAPGGGRGLLKSYLPRPALAPAGDPPYVETVGQLSAECVSDGQGDVLRIRIEPGRYADLLAMALGRSSSAPAGWGLHPLDINLVQGNMLDMIAAQSAAWGRR